MNGQPELSQNLLLSMRSYSIGGGHVSASMVVDLLLQEVRTSDSELERCVLNNLLRKWSYLASVHYMNRHSRAMPEKLKVSRTEVRRPGNSLEGGGTRKPVLTAAGTYKKSWCLCAFESRKRADKHE